MKNKLYAITGGIGTGKSLVCSILKNLGYNVFSADAIHKELLNEKSYIEKIYKIVDIPYKNGDNYNSKLVSQKIFNNPLLRNKLNEFTHKIIMDKMLTESKKYNGIVFNEVPLLFESGYENMYDGVIVILRELSSRINSIKVRSSLTEEEINKIIKSQYNYDNIPKNKHILIVNDGDISSLENKIRAVIKSIEESCS